MTKFRRGEVQQYLLRDPQLPQREQAKAAAPGADAGQEAGPGRGFGVGLFHQSPSHPFLLRPCSATLNCNNAKRTFVLIRHQRRAMSASPKSRNGEFADCMYRGNILLFCFSMISLQRSEQTSLHFQLPPYPIKTPALSLTPTGRLGLTLERKLLPECALVAKRVNLDFWASFYALVLQARGDSRRGREGLSRLPQTHALNCFCGSTLSRN